jgi:hypothetical protein
MSDDLEAQMAADAAAASPEDALQRVAGLAAMMIKLQADVTAAETALSAAKLAYARVEQTDLPELMAEMGLSMIKLEDGSTVEVRRTYASNINDERRERAHAWLIEHGFGGLIKTRLEMSFGRGQEAEAAAAAQQIEKELGIAPVVEQGIHSATLSAFVKEQIEAGNNIPRDLFGVFEIKKAKLTAPKVTKRKRA